MNGKTEDLVEDCSKHGTIGSRKLSDIRAWSKGLTGMRWHSSLFLHMDRNEMKKVLYNSNVCGKNKPTILVLFHNFIMNNFEEIHI